MPFVPHPCRGCQFIRSWGRGLGPFHNTRRYYYSMPQPRMSEQYEVSAHYVRWLGVICILGTGQLPRKRFIGDNRLAKTSPAEAKSRVNTLAALELVSRQDTYRLTIDVGVGL